MPGGWQQTVPDGGTAGGSAAESPDPGQVVDAIARYQVYRALREFAPGRMSA